MGQVRKDILNGWKEIGGYVGRDIRTVERWEKQRGLPVRRVPGAGRATVYALIAELNHWLEKSKSEILQPDPAADDLVPGQPEPAFLNSLEAAEASAQAVPSPSSFASSAQAIERPPLETTTVSSLFGGRPRTGREQRIAVVTLAAAAGMVLLLASPFARSHVTPMPEPATHVDDSGEHAAAPYRSSVPGVDDLYLRGLYFYEQRTPKSLEQSREDFMAATAKDPSYAPAYAGLANTYNLLREYAVLPDSEAYPKARQAAEHAAELDPNLPEAHASLGFIDFFWSWDAAAAEHEFQTAIALDPGSVLAHHWYGSMLIHQGRLAEAIHQLDIAQRLEPTSAAVLSTRGLAIGLSGRRGEAVDLLQEVINETPGVSSPHAILATLSLIQPRDPARYLDEMRRSAELRHNVETIQVSSEAASAYRSGGEPRMWQALLAAEERLHPGQRTYLMVEAEAALGRNDAALADLTVLERRHDPATIGINIDPTLVPLHQDPRFIQVAAAAGLPRIAPEHP